MTTTSTTATTTSLPPFDEFVPQRRFADAVAISPDGSEVAYVTNDGGQFNLWIAPIGGDDEPRAARQLTTYTSESVRAVAWSPDGASLAYTADRDGDEQYQIYVVGADGGGARRISTVAGRQHALARDPFTPDGRYLVYAGNDRDEAVQDLIVAGLTSGEVRRIESVPGEILDAVGVSPDGRWLLGAVARSNTDMDAFIVDLHADEWSPRVLTASTGESVDAPMQWFGDSTGFALISNADSEFMGLKRCSLDGTAAPLVDAEWDVEMAAISTDGSTLAWSVNESGTSSVAVRTSEDEASPRRLELPPGVLEAADLAPDGSFLIGLFGGGRGPRDLVRIDLPSGVITRLTESAPPALSVVEPVDPTPVSYPTHDGRDIPGWLYRPAGSGSYAVVLSIHGGPESQERPQYLYSGLYQFLLSRGIGVFAPNVRGSTGYGSTYQKLIHRDWGGDELGDLEHAVRFLAGLDWVDASRIAVFGGSYGGFAALSCVSRLPDLFAAGVSVVGPSNLVTVTQSVPPTWRPLMKAWIGDPVEDEELLLSRSPITYADQITAPLMVVQGANDPRVAKAESDQIVESLRARGVDVRYDVYADEGHGFTKRSNEIEAIGNVGAFLVDHLTAPD